MAGVAAPSDESMSTKAAPSTPQRKTPWYLGLTMQVFVAAVIGVALGH